MSHPERLLLENEALRSQVLRLAVELQTGAPGAEQGLTDLLDVLPAAAFVLDDQRKLIAWNSECERLTSASRASVLGRSDRPHAKAFFGHAVPTLIDYAELSDMPADVPYSNVRRQGDVLYGERILDRACGGPGVSVACEATILVDVEGRRRASMEVVRDVTSWREVEDALRLSERKFRNLFETAGDAILLMRDGRFIDCNERALEIYGRSREHIIGAEPHELSPRSQPDGTLSREQALIGIQLATARGPQTFEWVHCRGDGTPFTAEVTLNRLDLGPEVLMLAIVRDISARKKMEQELRERQSQLALILDNVSDVIFAVAVDERGGYRFSQINRRFMEATGLPESAIVGQRVQDVIPAPAHELVFGKYREAIETGKPAHWEEISEYPAGQKVGHVTVVPVCDAAGTCTQLVGLVHDISEVRRLTDDLRKHSEVLDRSVQERTAQLAARNQELKDFAYTVSHDLKAPLRGIAGYANELERKHSASLSDRARFCLSQIRTATSHLDRLIEDLLHYSRLDRETPSLTDVDLRAVLASIVRDRELIIAERQAMVSWEVSFDMMRTWERGLVQVLTNLIDNALKYSPSATPPQVRITGSERPGGWVLCVADKGIGFDMQYHERIFGLFNRLVRMEDYEGTGAGLAIARKVTGKLGGRLWAESAPGQGARFFVEIPRPDHLVPPEGAIDGD